MKKEQPYITAYTENTMDHRLKHGMQLTACLRCDILALKHTVTKAEQALADDAAEALDIANQKIMRLHDVLHNGVRK